MPDSSRQLITDQVYSKLQGSAIFFNHFNDLLIRIIAICDSIYPRVGRQCYQRVTWCGITHQLRRKSHPRLSSRFLFGHPGKMALQGLITSQQFEAVEMLGEGHFIEALMNALVA